MANEDEPTPTVPEIKQQLALMLASTRFRAAENPSAFLKLVVERAIDGKNTTEEIIGKTLFGPKFSKDESTDVRVTAINLRKTLTKYYEGEGAEDPVIIALPKPSADKSLKLPAGEAYRPFSTYNPKHAIAQEYALGLYHLRPKHQYKAGIAAQHFMNVIKLCESHAAAHIGVAEAWLIWAFLHAPALMHLYESHRFAERAVHLAPEDWHSHAAFGAALFFYGERELAEEQFKKAIELNEARALLYGWYHAFLFATDREEKAIELAKLRADGDRDNLFARAIYGFYVYLYDPEDAYLESPFFKYQYNPKDHISRKDQLQTARILFIETLQEDHNCWPARLGIILVELESRNFKDALTHHNVLQTSVLNAEDDFLFPGLSAICLKKNRVYSDKALKVKLDRVLDSREYVPWFQLAVGFLAFNASDEAPAALSRAWTELDPMIIFSKHLPLFYPLRGGEVFDDLVRARLRPLRDRVF